MDTIPFPPYLWVIVGMIVGAFYVLVDRQKS